MPVANGEERAKKRKSMSGTRLERPASGPILVAFLISPEVNVIDLSGPWGAFESVMLPGQREQPFRLFTVADELGIVRSSSDLRIQPHHTFADMPAPHVVVVPAQQGSEALLKWLREEALKCEVVMSVCTGAFKLAQAGLLDGRAATTHHDFFERFEREHPAVDLKRGVRFVEGEKISTAAGLTSGTDLALRVVERYFDRETAQRTAEYMEYQSRGWIV